MLTLEVEVIGSTEVEILAEGQKAAEAFFETPNVKLRAHKLVPGDTARSSGGGAIHRTYRGYLEYTRTDETRTEGRPCL